MRVDWFNNRRLLEPIGDVPSAEYEMMYYRQLEESAMMARLKQPSIRNTRGDSAVGLGQFGLGFAVINVVDDQV